MRSLLLSEYNHLEVVDLPVPHMAPNEVMVRSKPVASAGVMSTDTMVHPDGAFHRS